MPLYRAVLVCLLCLSLVTETAADDWAPPADPDLHDILNEARLDAMAGRYEVALEKHIWFHNNAVAIDEGMSGVRRSFALFDWLRLGQEYQPAMDKLRQIRDELFTRINDEGYDSGAFHDLVAINSVLEEESLTVEAFKHLDATNPEAARRAFNFANSALIKDKEYVLYGKYVAPRRDFLLMKHNYELGMLEAEGSDGSTARAEFSINSFRNKAATLVAILVVNGRATEAANIMEQAKALLEDPAFHAELASASEGNIPAPWP